MYEKLMNLNEKKLVMAKSWWIIRCSISILKLNKKGYVIHYKGKLYCTVRVQYNSVIHYTGYAHCICSVHYISDYVIWARYIAQVRYITQHCTKNEVFH